MTDKLHDACAHDVILNGACFYCGTTELDGVLVSPKPADEFIPAGRLSRGPTGQTIGQTAPTPRRRIDEPGGHRSGHRSGHRDNGPDDRE